MEKKQSINKEKHQYLPKRIQPQFHNSSTEPILLTKKKLAEYTENCGIVVGYVWAGYIHYVWVNMVIFFLVRLLLIFFLVIFFINRIGSELGIIEIEAGYLGIVHKSQNLLRNSNSPAK
ncbi:8527_t:CDS:2 [Gigaspora rosea]|nr:8527_t:CDS:2 [Gigaspora rosea]